MDANTNSASAFELAKAMLQPDIDRFAEGEVEEPDVMAQADVIAEQCGVRSRNLCNWAKLALKKLKVKPRQRGWSARCQTNAEGTPLDNLVNVLLALREAPPLAGCFAFDEMACTPVLVKPIPGVIGPQHYPHPVVDDDITCLQEWLQHAGLRHINQNTLHVAVHRVALEYAFHPVRNYLNGLVWDGQPRLAGWLEAYVGCDCNAYYRHISTCFLLQMVARIIQPGCKCDHMIVFEGGQGTLKSSACQVLAGEWFSDTLPDLNGGDMVRVSMHLRGKWLIEISELASISRADAARLKAFLTQNTEQYTPKYARKEVTEPRQCVFVGTTNKMAYLRDETGARRFWPVRSTGTIDVDGLQLVRDQLFAEAIVKFNAGVPWWPDQTFERQYIAPQQALRFDADVWEQQIAEYLHNKTDVTVSEVARDGLRIETPRLSTTDRNRITAVLEGFNWWRGEREDTRRPWFPPRPKDPTKDHNQW
jgi:predicted P-loop ATPase